ncbi:MAG: ABC transporter ATP-binding protein [Chloroflexi bacterium]|nr:ABC transporter ATP-binding protein [Chloroflexota bacterium]MCH8223579.1 ABC transporter ATP-binding protein [Chloroflexota bacterium]
MDSVPIIQAEGIDKIYRSASDTVHALRNVSVKVESGEIVAVMGPSGCGKTTLLNCLSGLDSIDSGNVRINGQSLRDLTDDQLSEYRARSMGFVFQTFNLLPVLSAQENVELPLLVAGVSSKKATEIALGKLDDVGLVDWANRRPAALSGGQRQRVAVARALANEPAIVWADEPTGNLDTENEREIMELIVRLNKENGQTFVLVTHSDDVAKSARRIIRMRDGEIISDTNRDGDSK